jgi:hypothetical protein
VAVGATTTGGGISPLAAQAGVGEVEEDVDAEQAGPGEGAPPTS